MEVAEVLLIPDTWGRAQREFFHYGINGFYHPTWDETRQRLLSVLRIRRDLQQFFRTRPFCGLLSQPHLRRRDHVEKSLGDGGFGIVMNVRRAEERSSLQRSGR